jgi:hypothetical protein
MLDRRLLSSAITTSCSPFTYIQETRTDLTVGKLPMTDLLDQCSRLQLQESLQTTYYLNAEDALCVTIERYCAQAGDLRIVAAECFQHLGEDAGLLAEDLEVVLVWPQRNQLHLTLWRCIAQ